MKKVKKIKNNIILFKLLLGCFCIFGCSNFSGSFTKDYNDTTYQVSTNLKGDTSYIIPMVNGVFQGWSYSYYESGKLWGKQFYVDGKLNGPVYIFTENGDTAVKEIWNNGWLIEKQVFWQEIPYMNSKKFYLLSDSGFYAFKNGKNTIFKSSTNYPEGIILEDYDDYGIVTYYVLKNGSWEKYPAPDRIKAKLSR